MQKEEKVTEVKEFLKKGHTYRQWALAIIVNITLLANGMDCGWMSPMTEILQSDSSPLGEAVSDTMISWIASITFVGAGLSVPFYSFVADKFGRKFSVIAIVIPQVLAWTVRLSFASPILLLISRILSGIATGGCYDVIPIYLKEISQDSIRGALGTLLAVFENTGILVMYIMGAYLEYHTILQIVLGITIVNLALLVKAPESPQFLIKQNKVEEAINILAYLRGLDKNHEDVQNEIMNMKSEEEYFRSLPNLSLKTIPLRVWQLTHRIPEAIILALKSINALVTNFEQRDGFGVAYGCHGLQLSTTSVSNRVWRKAMLIITPLMTLQPLNGTFSIIIYASSILPSAGTSINISLETLSFAIPSVMILGSLIALAVVDRVGRKVLSTAMFSVSAVSMLCIATSVMIRHNGGSVPNWLPITAMVMTVGAYSGGIVQMPVIVMMEMLNFQIRAKVNGVLLSYSLVISFVSLFVYIPMSNAFGMHSAFFYFAGINIIGALFSGLIQPETREKSIEEIEEELGGGRKMVPNKSINP